MAKVIKYKVDGVVCTDRCPHTGYMIGSTPCFCCEWYDHKSSNNYFTHVAYCNHP